MSHSQDVNEFVKENLDILGDVGQKVVADVMTFGAGYYRLNGVNFEHIPFTAIFRVEDKERDERTTNPG